MKTQVGRVTLPPQPEYKPAPAPVTGEQIERLTRAVEALGTKLDAIFVRLEALLPGNR